MWMMLSFTTLLAAAAGGIALLAVGNMIYNLYFHKLARFPGPWWARATPLWELHAFGRGDLHLRIVDVHKKYGTVVRVSPWRLSVSSASPSCMKPLMNNTNKTKFATAFIMDHPQTFLTALPADEHRESRRNFLGMYTLKAFRPYEDTMDKLIGRWISNLHHRFALTGQAANMVLWSRYLTFDVIAKISLGKDAECIETDDRNRFVETVGWAIALMGVFNRFPEVYKVVSRGWMSRYTVANSDMKYGFGPALKLHETALEERVKFGQRPGHSDLLDGYLALRQKDGTPFSYQQVFAESRVPMLAGHDTVSGAISRTVFDLCTHPLVQAQLLREIASYVPTSTASGRQVIGMDELRQVPYLDAVIRETLRLNPLFIVPVLREAPVGGLTLPTGEHVDEGTVVEVMTWVTNRDQEFFGPDAETYCPERWLPQADETPEMRARRLQLDTLSGAFGYGSRICAAKDFAMVECAKAVFELFRNFEVELAPGTKDWGMNAYGFWVGGGYEVVLRPRLWS